MSFLKDLNNKNGTGQMSRPLQIALVRKQLKVLVVDDNSNNLFVMKMILDEITDIDFEVKTALNG